MRIDVTQKHIRTGVRGSTCSCPISKAIADSTGLLVGTHDRGSGYFPYALLRDLMGYLRIVDLTSKEKKFMRSFDKGRSVAPFSFDLPIDKDTWHGKE